MTDRLDLALPYQTQIEALLREHVPDAEVWAYGSRVNGTSHESSALNLVLRGPNLEQLGTGYPDLLEAIEESNIPILIQAHDWATLPESLRREIKRAYVSIQAPRKDLQPRQVTWSYVTLGDLLSFSNGASSPERSDSFPHPVYGSNGIIGSSIKTNTDPNAVVIGRVGSYCGSLHFSENPSWVTDNAIRGNPVEGTDAKFVYYLLRTLNLNEWRTGSGQPLLNQAILSSIPTTVPSLPEQRAIAHVLGTLDDKIELNRRMNETLEQMARALFKSWFVDFDPVRAKMDGRWRPGQSLPGLPAHLYDLFPSRLVPSELSLIPEGWEVKPLKYVVDVVRGLSYKGSGLSSNGMPMHNLNSVYEGGGYKDDGIKYYIGDFQERHVTKPADVIVANTEQGHDRLLIGFAAMVPRRFGRNGLFSHHIYRVRPNSSCHLSRDFVCHLLNTQVMHDTVSGYATGTTVNMLPVDALRIPPIVVPPTQLVTTFSTIAETARIRHEFLIAECQYLAAQRDALLPVLVSRQVRTGETESVVANVIERSKIERV